jgi:hypothetical protein
MNRTFRIIKLVFLVIGILLLLAIPATGLISAAVNWKGVCYGFTDGQAPCSWWQYARNEMFWAMFIFIPFFFLAAVVWAGMSLAQFIKFLLDRPRKNAQ